MPRNSSGTYALPAGNPVVTNTLIQSTWANTTLSDVSTAMTDSLDRNGRGAMLAPLKNIDGTATAPSLSFSSEGTMGIYRAAAGVLGFAVGGALVLSLASTGLTFTTPLILPIGSATAPSIGFVANTNTGLYSPGTNQVALTTNGVQRVNVDASGNVQISQGVIGLGGTTNIIQASTGAGTLTLQTGGANNRVFIDASGRVIVGSITATNNMRVGQLLAGVTVGNVGGAAFTTYNATSTGTTIDLQHSAGTTDQSFTTIGAANFGLGSIVFRGSNGTAFGDGALIGALSDAAWTGSSQATYLAFSTTASGATTVTERLRIDSAGNVGVGRTSLGSRLDVVGNTLTGNSGGGFDGFVAQSTNSVDVRLFANGGSSNGFVGTNSNHVFYFITNAVERARFDTSGNFNVGGQPAALISGMTSRITGQLAGPVAVIAYDTGTANNQRIGMFADSTANLAGFDNNYASTTNGMVFRINASEKMRITSAGAVQITGSLATTGNITNTQAANTTSQLTLTGSGAYSSIVSLGAGGGGSGQVQASGGSLVLGAPTGQSIFQAVNAVNITAVSGSGLNVVGFVQAVTGSSAAASNSNWSTQYVVVGPNAASGTGAAFGVGYNTTLDQSELLSLAPGSAWKPLRLFATSFRFITGGSTTVLDITTAGVITDASSNELGWKDIPQNTQTGAYVLVVGDRGKSITITTGGVTVPTGVFSAGNVNTITNNSGTSQTITQGASVTMHQAGTTNTGNRTLLPWGICTIEWLPSNVCIISGNIT